MIRKAMIAATMALVGLTAACNSITGTDGGQRSPAPSPVNKVCLDNERAVDILSPAAGQIVHASEWVYVSWDALYMCGDYTATLQVSYDDGTTYQTVGQAQNATSMMWHAPSLALPVRLQVTVQDRIGALSDAVSLARRIATARGEA